ncbi:MAG: sensory rhodopsin transducer [Chloroflexi bacterium]|nr:sensory rhodopsin transducer [Chloroflexota bacterium]MCY4248249.1 sensory rhodopsin transducer [Chloroflexota bacterium]
MPTNGALTWLVPDAYLAEPADADPVNKNHESICVLNVTPDDANILLDFYFEDRPPVEGIAVVVPAKRCPHLRLDKPEQIGGLVIPFDVPYGLRLRSDVPIVVQYSRMYASGGKIDSLITTMAYPVD